jgi:hypothetical protein
VRLLLLLLQGEHGTGRNIAPFVEVEWGQQATAIMRRIKDAFDPDNLLNPGVILNPVRLFGQHRPGLTLSIHTLAPVVGMLLDQSLCRVVLHDTPGLQPSP